MKMFFGNHRGWIITLTILAFSGLPFNCPAQNNYYYYPPGYYQPRYPPGYYYPQQTPIPPRRPAQKKQQPEKTTSHDKRSETRHHKESTSPDAPVESKPEQTSQTVDVSNIHGPYLAYDWKDTDNLPTVARASHLSPAQLLALNNLTYKELQSGQIFKLPETTAAQSLIAKTSQSSREIWRGVRGAKRIALTFDAGGEPDASDVLLDNLTQAHVPATFFATGTFATKHRDIIQKISAAGFPIHNHSWSHPDFTTISDDKIAQELNRTDDLISEITSHPTKPLFRCPYGASNRRVFEAAAAQGFQSVYWTLDSLDSVGDHKSPEFVTNRILHPPTKGASTDHFLDGAIILMHVGEKGSADAIPAIVDGLKKRGFQFVTVDEIITPPSE